MLVRKSPRYPCRLKQGNMYSAPSLTRVRNLTLLFSPLFCLSIKKYIRQYSLVFPEEILKKKCLICFCPFQKRRHSTKEAHCLDDNQRRRSDIGLHFTDCSRKNDSVDLSGDTSTQLPSFRREMSPYHHQDAALYCI